MLFSHRADTKLILILEVQSSMVRGSLVLLLPGAAPEIVYSQSLEIEYRPDAASSYYVQTTLDGVSSLVGSMLQGMSTLAHNRPLPRAVAEVHFVLSSPWVISQAKTVSMSFEKDTPITADRIHKILEEERAQAGFGPKTETETIEEKVFDVRLNGYSVASWKGKAARELEVSYALSVATTGSMKDLRTAVSQLVSAKNTSMHSSLLLQYISLRDAHIPGDTYMLIHAHGELTDMVIVRHGSCSFFGSYPIGSNSVVRMLAVATHTDKKTAESVASMYTGHHMDSAEEARIGGIMDAVSMKWAAELLRLADSAGSADSGGRFMPANIFMIAHAHEDLFESAIRAAYPRSAVGALSVDMAGTYARAIAAMQG